MIRSVGVVVPAHDEQDLLPSCLARLRRAARELPGLPVHVIVVADACRDRTAQLALRGGASVVAISARNVGAARAAGVRAVLRRTGPLHPADVWLATTDADTLVPPGWLRRQVRYAGQGWDAVVGTVRVADWSGYRPATRAAFLERYGAGTGRRTRGPGPAQHRAAQNRAAQHGHSHVHGANLGFRASAYLAAGGFPAARTAEDRAFVTALVAGGGQVLWTRALPVVTSARREARAPHGFSRYLADLDAATA